MVEVDLKGDGVGELSPGVEERHYNPQMQANLASLCIAIHHRYHAQISSRAYQEKKRTKLRQLVCPGTCSEILKMPARQHTDLQSFRMPSLFASCALCHSQRRRTWSPTMRSIAGRLVCPFWLALGIGDGCRKMSRCPLRRRSIHNKDTKQNLAT